MGTAVTVGGRCRAIHAHREAVVDGDRAYEFTLDVTSPVGFVTMPLAIRLVGDAAIVSVLSLLGHETKASPVWGTALDLRLPGQVSTDRPVRIRIDVSHDASRSHASGARYAVRFGLWTDDQPASAARGTLEIRVEHPALGVATGHGS